MLIGMFDLCELIRESSDSEGKLRAPVNLRNHLQLLTDTPRWKLLEPFADDMLHMAKEFPHIFDTSDLEFCLRGDPGRTAGVMVEKVKTFLCEAGVPLAIGLPDQIALVSKYSDEISDTDLEELLSAVQTRVIEPMKEIIAEEEEEEKRRIAAIQEEEKRIQEKLAEEEKIAKELENHKRIAKEEAQKKQLQKEEEERVELARVAKLAEEQEREKRAQEKKDEEQRIANERAEKFKQAEEAGDLLDLGFDSSDLKVVSNFTHLLLIAKLFTLNRSRRFV